VSAELPNARLLTVAGAAHQVGADAPGVVLAAVDIFLCGDWPASAVRVMVLNPAPANRE
jgi:hypothetical protein